MSCIQFTRPVDKRQLVEFEVLDGVVAHSACAVCEFNTVSFIELIAMDVSVEDILDSRGFQHF